MTEILSSSSDKTKQHLIVHD
jgi:DNA ligase-1